MTWITTPCPPHALPPLLLHYMSTCKHPQTPTKHQTTLFNFEELWQPQTDRQTDRHLQLSCSSTAEQEQWKCQWSWVKKGKTLGGAGNWWDGGEGDEETDVCLPCTVVTVVTTCGNVRDMHLTGTCSALLAVRTEHQYRLSVGYSIGPGDKTLPRVAGTDCVL